MAFDYEAMIADTYDAQYADLRDGSGDAAFYAGLAEEIGGPVLELGCGTGRMLLPIAETGVPCVGVDPSAEMLRVFRAKERPSTLELVQATAQQLDLPRRDFGLAFFGFRAFMHLETVDEQLQALARVRDHLRPGGWLALDLFEPMLDRIATPSEHGEQPPFDWDGRSLIRAYDVTRDHARQLQEVVFTYRDAGSGEELGVERVMMRWTYRYELEHLLVRAGFEPLRWSSGYDGRPYVGKGDIVVVAVKR